MRSFDREVKGNNSQIFIQCFTKTKVYFIDKYGYLKILVIRK